MGTGDPETDEVVDEGGAAAPVEETQKEAAEEVPKEVPEEVPKEVPQEVPVEVPKEVPEEVPKEVPQEGGEQIEGPVAPPPGLQIVSDEGQEQRAVGDEGEGEAGGEDQGEEGEGEVGEEDATAAVLSAEGMVEGAVLAEDEAEVEPELEFEDDDVTKAPAGKGKGKDKKGKKGEKKEEGAGKKKGEKKKPAGKSKKEKTPKEKPEKEAGEKKGGKEKKGKKKKKGKKSLAEGDQLADRGTSIIGKDRSLHSRLSIKRSSVISVGSMDSGSSYTGSEESHELKKVHSTARTKGKKKGKDRASLDEMAVKISEQAVEGGAKKKKKGKGKKKKKKGKGTDEEETTEVESEIKEKVEGEAEEVEKKPKKKKGGKKGAKKGKKAKKGKELTPKEQAKLEEDRKKQEEERAAKEAEELRLRLIEEKKVAVEKEKREVVEQNLRIEQLDATAKYIEEIKQAGLDAYMGDKIRDEWDKYLECDGRPDPGNVPEMNTYLHLWGNEIETMTKELAIFRTNEMYNLLGKLQDLIDDPFDVAESTQVDWKWIRSMFREHQVENLDFCTYRLIRNIDTKLNRIDIPTADFRLKEENFALCLWVPVQLPIPMPNPRNPSRPRINMDWPEMSMNVLFPNSLDCERLVLRAMYVKYNHLSDTSQSYDDPAVPDALSKDLAELTAQEWNKKLRYKYDNRVIVPVEPTYIVNEEGEMVLDESELPPELQPGDLAPVVPYQRLNPTASELALAMEDEAIAEAKRNMEVVVNPGVINLRKYVILGGIYYLDLFVQPTQPQEMVSFEIFITDLVLPCKIETAPFYVEYLPPPPPAPGVRRQPEEIEEELVKQEQEFDKLIFVTLQLPTHILWMDVPMVCHWDQEEKEWTTTDVHDFKHIEEKGYVTFRTGKFGPFAIATYKYPNFPFQAWEMRPESDGSVTFQITAAILVIDFHVKDHMVCLSQIQNAPNNNMNDHLNVYYKLPRLIRIMRDTGVDIFPAFDSFFYIEGTCEKYWPMEQKTYYGMAMTANAYNFTWSRWNMTSDYRTVVMQARLYKFDKPKQLNFSTCMVTPLNAAMIECTEVSPAFSAEHVEGMKFYADFYHLMKGTSNMATKDRISLANLSMVNSLANLLSATRVLSFS